MDRDRGSGRRCVARANDRRAATTIAGHTGDRGRVRASLGDGDPKVRAGAYRALALLGPIAPTDLAAAVGDPSPIVRRAICELAGARCRGPFGVLLDDDDPAVVEAACFAVGEIVRPAVVGLALATIARTHEDAALSRGGRRGARRDRRPGGQVGASSARSPTRATSGAEPWSPWPPLPVQTSTRPSLNGRTTATGRSVRPPRMCSGSTDRPRAEDEATLVPGR